MRAGEIFNVEIDGVLKSAEIIDVIEYSQERYAVYAVSKDDDMSELFVSKIVTRENGSDELIPEVKEEVRDYILKIVHETINR